MPATETPKKIVKTKESYGEVAIIFIATIGAWIAGIAVSSFLGYSLEPFLQFDIITNTVILTFAAFVFAVLLFGFLAPLFFIVLGMMQQTGIFENPIYALLVVPMLFAAYAGITTGIYLLRDLQGKDNIFNYKRKILIYLGVSLVLAVLMPVIVMLAQTYLA